MEVIVNSLTNVILSRNQKVYTLPNGVEISLSKIVLKGDNDKKRTAEARQHAERLFDEVKRLKLL